MKYPTCIILLLLVLLSSISAQELGMITASGREGQIKGIIQTVNFDRVTLKTAAGSTHEVGIDDVEPVDLPNVLKWLSIKMPASALNGSRLRATLTKTSKTNLERTKEPRKKVTAKNTDVIYHTQITNSGAATISKVTVLLLVGRLRQEDNSISNPVKYHTLQMKKISIEEVAAGKVVSTAFEVIRESDVQTITESELPTSSGKTSISHYITTSNSKIESAVLVIFDSSGLVLFQSPL